VPDGRLELLPEQTQVAAVALGGSIQLHPAPTSPIAQVAADLAREKGLGVELDLLRLSHLTGAVDESGWRDRSVRSHHPHRHIEMLTAMPTPG
jgi:hypothetical protein